MQFFFNPGGEKKRSLAEPAAISSLFTFPGEDEEEEFSGGAFQKEAERQELP